MMTLPHARTLVLAIKPEHEIARISKARRDVVVAVLQGRARDHAVEWTVAQLLGVAHGDIRWPTQAQVDAAVAELEGALRVHS